MNRSTRSTHEIVAACVSNAGRRDSVDQVSVHAHLGNADEIHDGVIPCGVKKTPTAEDAHRHDVGPS